MYRNKEFVHQVGKKDYHYIRMHGQNIKIPKLHLPANKFPVQNDQAQRITGILKALVFQNCFFKKMKVV